MNDFMNLLKKNKKIVFVLLGVFILFIVLLFLHPSVQKASGLSYLESQKNKDIGTIQSHLDSRLQQEVQEKIDSGEMKIYDAFSNYVFLGDSRMEGFSSYHYIPSENNLAKIGVNINSIDEDLETIKSRQPKNIYLSFGVNDIESNLGSSADGLHYDQLLESQVKKIVSVDPDAKIYINSIIPVNTEVQSNQAIADLIPTYNEQIKAVCEKNGWVYIDNSDLIQDPALFERDGIHFAPSLYEQWAAKMYLASQ